MAGTPYSNRLGRNLIDREHGVDCCCVGPRIGISGHPVRNGRRRIGEPNSPCDDPLCGHCGRAGTAQLHEHACSVFGELPRAAPFLEIGPRCVEDNRFAAAQVLLGSAEHRVVDRRERRGGVQTAPVVPGSPLIAPARRSSSRTESLLTTTAPTASASRVARVDFPVPGRPPTRASRTAPARRCSRVSMVCRVADKPACSTPWRCWMQSTFARTNARYAV